MRRTGLTGNDGGLMPGNVPQHGGGIEGLVQHQLGAEHHHAIHLNVAVNMRARQSANHHIVGSAHVKLASHGAIYDHRAM